jgi:endo-alpha-1,4-polygalactosaminidase (GH114 family)
VVEKIRRLAGGAVLILALTMGLGNAAPQPANDFVYQLQRIDLRAIGETKFDLVIIDYSRDGSDARRFTASQISALKDSPGGPKRVLAYMSIGEAEDYRWYWRRSWGANGAGKPVLVTDHVTQWAKIDAFYRKALSHGYVPYATRRDLDVLTINLGHAPD